MLSRPHQFAAVMCGASLAVAAAIFLAVVVFKTPLHDATTSAVGIFTSDTMDRLDDGDIAHLQNLIRRKHVVSSDQLITQISGFYSAVIQLLIGTFFVFGLLSFFVIRAHSMRQMEEQVEQRTEKHLGTYFESVKFHQQISDAVDTALQIHLEDLQDQVSELGNEIGQVTLRINAIEEILKAKKATPPQSEGEE